MIKTQLNQWELDSYIERHRNTVGQLKAGQPRPKEKACPEYLLLDEVTRLFERIPRFYLWPCNCRAMIEGCNQSHLTCIRFSNDRGIGWEISRERALGIVGEANRQGLMQSAELAVDDLGRLDGALCNCCSDCCFPHQLAARLQAEKPGRCAAIWPSSPRRRAMAVAAAFAAARSMRSPRRKKPKGRLRLRPYSSATCAGDAGSAPLAAPKKQFRCKKSENPPWKFTTSDDPSSG